MSLTGSLTGILFYLSRKGPCPAPFLTLGRSRRLPEVKLPRFAQAAKFKQLLPRRLGETGDLTRQRALAEANTAHLKPPQEGARTPAERATVVLANGELRL